MKQILINLLIQLITLVTPELRKTLCEGLKVFVKEAKQSKNPWDDILADILIHIFDCQK